MLHALTLLLLALAQAPGREAPAPTPQRAAAPAAIAGIQVAFDALVAANARTDPAAGEERARARRALLALPATAVREHLRTLADGAPTAGERRAALELLALIGLAPDVPAAMRFHEAGLDAPLADALHGICARDRNAFAALESVLARTPGPIRSLVLAAIERVGTPDAGACLGRCVAHGYGARPEAIARLGRMALTLREDVPEAARGAVRSALAMADGHSRRDAIVAAGRMQDSDSVPQLIALLDELDPAVRTDAAWALERISGLCFGIQPERWREWHASELEWWEDHSREMFDALRAPERRPRVVALIDISRLRLRRPQLVREVLPLLEHEEVACATLAARVLGRLGCDTAVPGLSRALDAGSEEVVAAAWQALKRITGKDLPPIRSAWESRPRS